MAVLCVRERSWDLGLLGLQIPAGAQQGRCPAHWMSLRRLKPDPQGALQVLRGSGGGGASAPCSPAKSTHLGILEERCGAMVTRPSGGITEQSGWRWWRGEDLPAGKRVKMTEPGGGRTFQLESGWRWRRGRDLPAGSCAHVLGGGLGTRGRGLCAQPVPARGDS